MSQQGLLDLSDEDTVALARLFSLLGDPTRVRIVLLLCRGEMNVTRLCQTLRMAQPTVSHHLGLLRRGGLLKTRRDGKSIHYALDDNLQYNEKCELHLRGNSGIRIRVIK